MSNRLTGLEIRNFRSLANVKIDLGALNVLFGPNGAGKSTFLDTVWFVRDCAIRGVDVASSERSHGIGALWDGADAGANISIKLETEAAKYEVLFGYSSGRIETFVGETLFSKVLDINLVERTIGSDKASFYHTKMKEKIQISLREPEKLAFTRYLDLYERNPLAASELDNLLRYVRFYHLREADFYGLKKFGSESSHHIRLWDRSQNLWSVLRNLLGKRVTDDCYDTIMDFMRETFPAFIDLEIEQTGPNTVYGNFRLSGIWRGNSRF